VPTVRLLSKLFGFLLIFIDFGVPHFCPLLAEGKGRILRSTSLWITPWDVIPKPIVFQLGEGSSVQNRRPAQDPSLRLKNGFAQDDASHENRFA